MVKKEGFADTCLAPSRHQKMPRPLRPFFGFRQRRVRRCRVLLGCLHARVRENCGQLAPPLRGLQIRRTTVERGFRALGNEGFESRSRSNNGFQVRTCTSRTSRTSSARELTGSSSHTYGEEGRVLRPSAELYVVHSCVLWICEQRSVA